MAEVFGTIGNEQVELNNAATERTLQALLAVMKTDSKALLKMAEKAGVEMGNIEEFNESIDEGTQTVENFNRSQANLLAEQEERYSRLQQKLTSLGDVTDQLMQGTLKTSDVFMQVAKNIDNSFVSSLVKVAAKLVSIQEQNFAAFQKMSSVGVNFAGDLTALRQAAADSYLTLDQFSNLVTTNSELFAKMGGSANQGAVAFAKFSNSILKGDFGTQITAMGYTFEDANQHMATYIGLLGVKDVNELKNSASLVESTKGYLDQLDRLSDITGKSRKELEENMKKQALTADVNITAARMTNEKQREAFLQNVQFMTAMYGDAGKDMAVAHAQNRSVTTESGKLLSSLAPKMQVAVGNMQKAGEMYGIGSKQYKEAQDEVRLAAQQAGTLPTALYSVHKGLQDLSPAIGTISGDIKSGQTSKEAMAKAEADRQTRIAKAQEGASAAMAQMNKAFAEIGAGLWASLSPVFELMTPLISGLAGFASQLASVIKEWPKVTGAVLALGTALSAYLAWKIKSIAMEKATSVGSRVLGGIAGPASGAPTIPGAPSSTGGAAASGMMSGIANGLKAFSSPQVLLGAAGFAAAIAAIGAGIAAAAWLTGAALPKLAEGMTSLQTLNGSKLIDASKGMGAVGLSLLTFAPVALFGIPAGIGLGIMADGLLKMNKVDTAQLLKVADAMEKVKAATPSVGESLKMGFSNIVSKVTGGSTTETPAVTSQNLNQSSDLNAMAAEMKRLNNVSTEMLRNIKEIAENTKRNVDATKSLNGNLFATV